MDNRKAFTDYIARRQEDYRKEQIWKRKKLENDLNSFSADGRENARRSHYYRGRNRAEN